MAFISNTLRLLIAPIFFILAIVNFQLGQDPEMAATGHAMHGAMEGATTYTQILTSMWLMYALMGLAHITPWFGLTKRSTKPAQGDY